MYPYLEISSKPGDLILDPIMGAGTTAIAALKTGKQFIGIPSVNYISLS